MSQGPPRVRHRRAAAGAALGALLLAVLAGALPAGAATVAAWKLTSIEHVDGRTQGQGFATVRHADGSTTRYFTGDNSVPPEMVQAGWNHLGDPDSASGYLFDAYQNADGGATSKLFRVTAPDGATADFEHHLVAGEAMNNSFAAVSPDEQWLVSGEWGAMARLLVFPTPLRNAGAPPPGADLPLRAQILLDTTVTDIQGCTFETATRLFCSSDDPVAERGLPRKPLLQVDLARALDGHDVPATVTPVFALPVPSSPCPIRSPGSWPWDMEVEGIDYNRWTGELAVVIIPPGMCGVDTRVFDYKSPSVPAASTTTTTVTSTSSSTSTTSSSVPTSAISMPAGRTGAAALAGAPSPPAPAAGVTATATLPATGSAAPAMVGAALLLLAIGGALTRWSRALGAPEPRR